MDNCQLTWLHLSDFHIGKDGYAQVRVLDKILEDLATTASAWRKPDLVFLTGDIANKGKPEEYKLFDDRFLTPLVEFLGDHYSERIFLIPGNHDVDRAEGRAVMRYDVLDYIPEFLDPTPESLQDRLPLTSRFKAFNDHPWYLECAKWTSSTTGIYSKRIKLDSVTIGVLCINTAWFCGGENEHGKLTPGPEMVEQGLKELSDCKPLFVIGHHPIEWFIPNHGKRIRSALAKASATYLHGHLHKSERLSSGTGATSLLSIQAGCSFYARNDDIWLPRLIWGGRDLSTGTTFLRPKKWNEDHVEWVIDSDAFSESLREEGRDFWVFPSEHSRRVSPQTSSPRPKSNDPRHNVPDGWVYLDPKFFENRRNQITEERILQYFEGRSPQWEDVLSGKIASRLIVEDLVSTISQGIEAREPRLTLFLGAGGEGKSTAFFQSLERLSQNPTINILWRSSPEKGLPLPFATMLLASNDTWLLASDEADSLVTDTFEALKLQNRQGQLHFFLTCRDTDWIENHGPNKDWDKYAHLAERRIKGLELKDAQAIVDSWARLGERGLGKLSGLSLEDAANQLLEAAKVEASSADGAFLGAMLRVRIGMALRDHVASLMVRLESREIPGLIGKNLLDAFALIAVPHALNILWLSKSILARALELDEPKLRKRILNPLGDEAAAAATGQYILTRHRAIAEVAMDIASNRFEIDPEEVLVALVQAAIAANEEGALVPNFVEWRYLSSRMFEQGNQALGVKLAAAALAADRKNSYLAVKLAQLYREAGQPEQSVSVFRKTYSQAEGNRAFFTEWATCESFLGNRAFSILIHALSLADDTAFAPPDNRDAGYGLVGATEGFVNLYDRFRDDVFLHAAAASNQLARRITLSKVVFERLETLIPSLSEWGATFDSKPISMYRTFVQGVEQACMQIEVNHPLAKTDPQTLTFNGLGRILRLQR